MTPQFCHWHTLWTHPFFSIFNSVQAQVLIISHPDYCDSHLCLAFLLLVQRPSVPELAFWKGHSTAVTCPSASLTTCLLICCTWTWSRCVLLYLFAFIPAIFWPWKGLCRLLFLLYTCQNRILRSEISSDTTVPIYCCNNQDALSRK